MIYFTYIYFYTTKPFFFFAITGFCDITTSLGAKHGSVDGFLRTKLSVGKKTTSATNIIQSRVFVSVLKIF